MLLGSCTTPDTAKPSPPPTEAAILHVDLAGSDANHHYALGSALPDAITPIVRRDDQGQAVGLEFTIPGPDAYVLGIVELDANRGTFHSVLELPFWLDGSAHLAIDLDSAHPGSGGLDTSWIEAFELARPWQARAEALGAKGDNAGLLEFERQVREESRARDASVASLLDIHRVRTLAALLPDAGRLDMLARMLPPEDPRWSLVSRQLPVLARTAGDRPAAVELLARLTQVNPANSVRTYASTWLVEQAVAEGDSAMAARYRSGLQAVALGLNSGAGHPLAVGNVAPPVVFPDMHDPNRAHALRDRGRPILIMLWSPWCGACEYEIPWWTLAHERYRDRLDFLAVAVDGTDDEVAGYLRKSPIAGEAAHLDEALQQSLEEQWDCSSVPHVVLLDAAGRVEASTRSLRGPEMLVVLAEYLERTAEP